MYSLKQTCTPETLRESFVSTNLKVDSLPL